jgi:hypothetical protein
MQLALFTCTYVAVTWILYGTHFKEIRCKWMKEKPQLYETI